MSTKFVAALADPQEETMWRWPVVGNPLRDEFEKLYADLTEVEMKTERLLKQRWKGIGKGQIFAGQD